MRKVEVELPPKLFIKENKETIKGYGYFFLGKVKEKMARIYDLLVKVHGLVPCCG